MSFSNLGLRAELVDAVVAKGYEIPTSIQAQSIPPILEGRDLMGGSQTGTGKTAAFTLPMLQLLASRETNGRKGLPRALVLTPTRELAAQVGESVSVYGKGLNLRSTVIFGGVGMNPQIDKLRRGVEIIVATPGRLLDHASQRNVNLSQIEILVLDEADRMLDMGFIHDIKKVLAMLPKKRQNLMFSATYSGDIRTLAENILHEPAMVEVARRNTAAELVTQVVHPVARADKRDMLSSLIKKGNWSQVLVFMRTKHGANRLAKQLEQDGISATAIHGNKSQNARTQALAQFKGGKVRVLVATDVASRGIDIRQLPHVVNYELPNVSEDYVHRIGRTGRAGEEGCACSLVSSDERVLLRDIEKLLGRQIPVEKIDGYEMNEEDIKTAPKPGGGSGGGRGGQRGGRQGGASNARSGDARSSTGQSQRRRRPSTQSRRSSGSRSSA
jgi:ATP-dependent RNA helicase RhlE